jgi:elongation factor 1-beta
MAAFSGFMGSKSYIEGYTFSPADSEFFATFEGVCPDATKYAHAYRWYIHIAALSGVRGIAAPAPKAAAAADDDDFDVFGEDDEEDDEPKESRKDMLARLKKEAEERTAKKEAKQRTLVGLEIKPWSMEQDLMELWKKITTTVVQPGLKWGENCNLVDVAFGIKKIQTTFVMGVDNSSDDVQEAIEALEDEVQSVEILSMNVL